MWTRGLGLVQQGLRLTSDDGGGFDLAFACSLLMGSGPLIWKVMAGIKLGSCRYGMKRRKKDMTHETHLRGGSGTHSTCDEST